MGKSSIAAPSHISSAEKSYCWFLTDDFDEEDADLIGIAEDEQCLYLARDWDNEQQYQTYAVTMHRRMMDFLSEMVTYKFGNIYFPSGMWYYFVWSKEKPKLLCNMVRTFDGNVQADSRRFWKMACAMWKGKKK